MAAFLSSVILVRSADVPSTLTDVDTLLAWSVSSFYTDFKATAVITPVASAPKHDHLIFITNKATQLLLLLR